MTIPNKGIEFKHIMDKNILYFDNCCTNICNCKDISKAKSELDDMYQYLKAITPEYFVGDKLSAGYKYLKQSLINAELSIPKDYIIESSPFFSFDMMDKKIPIDADFEFKLNWIVYMTRDYLYSKYKEPNIKEDDFANFCKIASRKVNAFCKKIGLNYKQIIIYPGFSKYYELYDGCGFHYLSFVSDGVNEAYVDCTYRQFFTSVYNNLNRLGIVGVSGCRAGIFMTMTKERLKLAEEILKKGWFMATPENIKNYFDGFALSFRNGLYYQKTNDYSYTTNYEANDYLRFLNGQDSQIYHESLETLGFQRTLKPTKK